MIRPEREFDPNALWKLFVVVHYYHPTMGVQEEQLSKIEIPLPKEGWRARVRIMSRAIVAQLGSKGWELIQVVDDDFGPVLWIMKRKI